MTFTEILAALQAASEATKAVIGLLNQHVATLDAATAAVIAHQAEIDKQGPATPPGPKE